MAEVGGRGPKEFNVGQQSPPPPPPSRCSGSPPRGPTARADSGGKSRSRGTTAATAFPRRPANHLVALLAGRGGRAERAGLTAHLLDDEAARAVRGTAERGPRRPVPGCGVQGASDVGLDHGPGPRRTPEPRLSRRPPLRHGRTAALTSPLATPPPPPRGNLLPPRYARSERRAGSPPPRQRDERAPSHFRNKRLTDKTRYAHTKGLRDTRHEVGATGSPARGGPYAARKHCDSHCIVCETPAERRHKRSFRRPAKLERENRN
ncbi:hypothetical protein HPB51_008298 [Rhipicephalus microplus]|uniref:Uncharacterized protein n=1 Tax=Rhipicephalus microplus TaxID=6941 RepID=A0A9J6EZM8_RHIMP|nr:hypothetical protein HPB51_008298 [Rhipicephalus microplus]